MTDLLDRFRAASASADWILHRPPSTPAAMLPELSHLVHHEQDGPRRVLGLELEWLTTGRRTATADDLTAIGGRLGAAMVELPLRDAGCLLPSWDELVALSAAARERDVRLHADGARIWESVPHWDRSLAEVG